MMITRYVQQMKVCLSIGAWRKDGTVDTVCNDVWIMSDRMVKIWKA